jgi:2-hydroxychromene-2-carboxylate isomerase
VSSSDGAVWYFDFVSPYSYFGLLRLSELHRDLKVAMQPILFAGLLNHWGHRGPAEIPPKRLWTYRHCVWLAREHGWPFRMPAAHPFNSLPYLRLAIAAQRRSDAIRLIFDELWTKGADAADPQVVNRIANDIGVDVARLADADVKSSLRSATEEAAARGVFGVPTLAIGAELFWGSDATDFADAYLADPALLSSGEMQRAASVPIGASREHKS